MNVYVESNFVLELALEQEQCDSCQALLALAEQDAVRLILPAFSLAEPYDTLIRHAKERRALKDRLAQEMYQLSRSPSYRPHISALQQVTGFLVQSIEDEQNRLNTTLEHLLHIAETIPLTQVILSSAIQFQTTLELAPQDAVIYASVLQHLQHTDAPASCFLTRNSRDFDDPDIVDTLDVQHCKVLFRFDHGYQYVKNYHTCT